MRSLDFDTRRRVEFVTVYIAMTPRTLRRLVWVLGTGLAAAVLLLAMVSTYFSLPTRLCRRFTQGRVQIGRNAFQNNRYYRFRRELAALERHERVGVAFAGDSHVALPNWGALLGRPDIAELGIEGDTAAGLLHRLDDVLALHADTIVILIGTNDMLDGRSVDDTIETISAIVERSADGGGHTILVSVPPVAKWVSSATEINNRIRLINEGLRTVAESNHVSYHDLHVRLAGGDGALRPEYTYDGIHMSAAGYAVWRVGLEKLLAHAPALQSAPGIAHETDT